MNARQRELLDKKKLNKSEAKELNLLFNNIFDDCFCNQTARDLLQRIIKRSLNEPF